MDIFQAIILGLIQGVTEWLPISSSGHLVIAQQFLGLEPPIVFDIMLHLGSLLVILLFFRRQIIELVSGAFRLEPDKLRMIGFVIIATIPIALVGLLLGDLVEEAFKSLIVVGIGLLFTAALLMVSGIFEKKDRREKPITLIRAVFVGIFQAFAILPGVSRSGSTISSGLISGVKKEDAAYFSFLIFIPAILGATMLEASNIGAVENMGAMFIGTLVSAVAGYFSLSLLMKIIKNKSFHYFSIYCLVLGIILIAVSL